MFSRRCTPAWIGITLLAAMFLSGQEGWPPCIDVDGDGYGNPASHSCPHPERDCDDGDGGIHPGAEEHCDAADNNCDGQMDEGCTCRTLDPYGYGPCDMLLGVVFDGEQCLSASGCGCEPDCAYFFFNLAGCELACF